MSKKTIALIPLAGMEWMSQQIKKYIEDINDSTKIEIEITEIELPRFLTGDAKAVLQNSVRGKDVFILVDVGNYNCEYSIFSYTNHLSPDDHFQNLVRTISAIGGKAARINVIMPLLYSARQDRRTLRESLDCAVALQHLEKIGVNGIMAFDVHDDRVQNAVPFVSFDNLMPTYQVIKTLCKDFPDLKLDENNMIMVSPDVGGTNRNLAYANELGIDMGMFYKRRNLNKVENGRNSILIHKYIGPSVKDKDVLIADDIIASGESMLDSAIRIKEMGARRIFVFATFGFFTNGLDRFNELYEKNVIDSVLITNASYIKKELLDASWFKVVDIVKYISLYIYSVHVGASITNIMNPHIKIKELLSNR